MSSGLLPESQVLLGLDDDGPERISLIGGIPMTPQRNLAQQKRAAP